MAALARSSNCIAFQTEIGIEQELAAGTLVFIPLVARKMPIDRMMVVRRSGSGARLATGEFLKLARRYLADIDVLE